MFIKFMAAIAALLMSVMNVQAHGHGYSSRGSYSACATQASAYNYAVPTMIQSYAPPAAASYCAPASMGTTCPQQAPAVQQYQQPVSQVDFGIVHPLQVQTGTEQLYTPPVQAQATYPAATSYGGAAQQQYAPQVQAQYSYGQNGYAAQANYGAVQAGYGGGYAAKVQKVFQNNVQYQPVQQVIVKKVIQQQQYVPVQQQQYVPVQAKQKIVQQQVIQRVKVQAVAGY